MGGWVRAATSRLPYPRRSSEDTVIKKVVRSKWAGNSVDENVSRLC